MTTQKIESPNERDLLKAGMAWASKVLDGNGRGFFITEGIRDRIAAHWHHGKQEPVNQALSALVVVRELENQLRAAKGTFINEARKNGASWTDVGDHLGISKQAAQQKYGKAAPNKTTTTVDVPLFSEGK